MALAAPTATAAPIDCTTLQATATWDIRYQEQEQFPNPVNKVRLDLYTVTKPYRLAACGVVVTATPQTYTIQAKSTKALLAVMGGSWLGDFYGVGQRGGQTVYFDAAVLTIGLPDGLFQTTVKIDGYFAGSYLPPGVLMAVRADAGTLRPLVYDGSFRSVEVTPDVKTLEIVVKSSKPVLWERWVLDVVHSKLTFTKKFPFPAK
ncbi:hypothetical protein GCM10017781_41600 [Deinococcus metalli]|nr:hypothetical protein GCM10017781_41600 [Deinococcus metalli]